jgi:hypothetical protein
MTGAVQMAEPTRIAPPTPAERRHADGWFRLVPLPQIRTRPWMEKAALGVFGLCLLGILGATQRAVNQAAESVPAPVAYRGLWLTDRPLYHPGEVVRFRYWRDSSQGDLVLYSLDGWENAVTGLTYPEPICGRFVERPGTEQVKQARTLPPSLPPGTYRLRGWVTALTSRRSRPAGYESVPFRVEVRAVTGKER